MEFLRNNFISATKEYTTFEKHIPAPYIRKSFVSDSVTEGKITIAVCGFYELYINGVNYTKGCLAPYIANPNDYIYCDEYTVPIEKGENVIGIILGNGFQNNPGGYVWSFDKSDFRSAPMVSVRLSYEDKEGKLVEITTDETFKTHPSPIIFDDYRFGEYYDANKEITGWNLKGFDDCTWENAITAVAPKGEIKLCTADPVVEGEIIEPIDIIKIQDGYIYDFGISHAGVCKLSVDAEKGQTITLTHTDSLKDGDINIGQVWFESAKWWERDKHIVHKDKFICKGGFEQYQPRFTYHGFRYVKVEGITDKQATKDLLKFVTVHTDAKTMGGFECDSDVVNKLQTMCVRSAISNFHYFPTDCPQREKNGWTGDAALSCEYFILNLDSHKSFREWMYNVIKSQREDGMLPGIVPTSGWGYDGHGPSWDSVLVNLPYYMYVYYGDTDIINKCCDAFIKYLKYLVSRADEKGLVHFGLCDWLPIGLPFNQPESPLEVTDTVMSVDIARKMAFLFDAIGKDKERDYALSIMESFRNAFREHLIDFDTMLVSGNCQTSQAMAIYYDIFNEDEKEKASRKLVEIIHNNNDSLSTGILGARVIFHVLSECGESELAYKMITKPEYPSFAALIDRGATTMWEGFCKSGISVGGSKNHHFWGDISAWFIKRIAGILYNPSGNNINEVTIKPSFIGELNFAKGYHITPLGKVSAQWKRIDEKVSLLVQCPENITATLVSPLGYLFEDGDRVKTIKQEKCEFTLIKQ